MHKDFLVWHFPGKVFPSFENTLLLLTGSENKNLLQMKCRIKFVQWNWNLKPMKVLLIPVCEIIGQSWKCIWIVEGWLDFALIYEKSNETFTIKTFLIVKEKLPMQSDFIMNWEYAAAKLFANTPIENLADTRAYKNEKI